MTSARKEKVAYRVKIFGAKLCILSNKNPWNCVKKQTIRIEQSRNHEKHLQSNRCSQKGRIEEVSS